MQRLQSLNSQFSGQATSNEWSHVKQAPPDAILGLSIGFKNDKDPRKVNLGIGAYRTEDGQPFVFPVIRQAEKAIANNHGLNKEYLPIDGL